MILVPYRSDGEHRDRVWDFTRRWLLQRHPNCPIYVGTSPAGPFNRSAAINRAAEDASRWDVAVVCDPDTVVSPVQLESAVHRAHSTGLLVSALTEVVELTQRSTARLLADNITDLRALRAMRTRTKDDLTQSSVIAVPRTLWDAVGGFDEGFRGWGCEDTAFWIAATRHAGVGRHRPGDGAPLRVPGPAYQLWHRSKIRLFDPLFYQNFLRLQAYQRAETLEQLPALDDQPPHPIVALSGPIDLRPVGCCNSIAPCLRASDAQMHPPTLLMRRCHFLNWPMEPMS